MKLLDANSKSPHKQEVWEVDDILFKQVCHGNIQIAAPRTDTKKSRRTQ